LFYPGIIGLGQARLRVSCRSRRAAIVFAVDHAEMLVFRRRAILEATEPLMSQPGIPCRGRDDLLPRGSGKPIAAH
jgi:hypothetical protein